ncbi:ABC transporter permease [Streptomyces monashensis]|uniref:ABC transporter permease n=1 Tax=Streptomyces monashensis TaxID=1678012 RepID=UPI00340B1B40
MTVTTTPPAAPAWTEEGWPLREELRTVGMVWLRELIRFTRNRARILSGFVQPVLFLFVLGYGMTSLVGSTGGFDFKKFVFPGIVSMTVVTTAIFSAISIVWDREFGFLREMLVAPVSRTALVVGKALGGASVATVQGTIMLALAPLIGVRLTAPLVGQVIGVELLMALLMTCFGVFVASRIQRMEGFSAAMPLLLFPMLFLSGALFPLKALPTWLTVLTRINPLTYAVDPLRHLVFAAQHMPPAAQARFPTGVTLFGYQLPLAAELGIVCACAALFLTLAVGRFGIPE